MLHLSAVQLLLLKAGPLFSNELTAFKIVSNPTMLTYYIKKSKPTFKMSGIPEDQEETARKYEIHTFRWSRGNRGRHDKQIFFTIYYLERDKEKAFERVAEKGFGAYSYKVAMSILGVKDPPRA